MRHHHHGLVMSLIPGGGEFGKCMWFELACGEKPQQILLKVIVITFTNKVNAEKPGFSAFFHKKDLLGALCFSYVQRLK